MRCRLIMLLLAVALVAGCKVVRYPPERVLPRPVPDPTPELIAEITGGPEAARRDREQTDEVERAVRAAVQRVIEIGRQLVGQRSVVIEGTEHRADCSGFVQACFGHAGLRVAGAADRGGSGTEILYRALERIDGLHEDEIPESGDLVFFSNTHDRNGNGRLDDEFTHVGFVDSVGDDGTIQFLHFVSGAVRIGRMNLLHPNNRVDEESGTIWNDPLRRRRKSDSSKVRYLTSQLWIGFGRPAVGDD